MAYFLLLVWGMLVKFSCGCIGFSNLSDEGKVLCVEACDGGRYDPPIGLFWRDLSGKEYEPLEPERAKELVGELVSLVGDGHRYREIRRLLG